MAIALIPVSAISYLRKSLGGRSRGICGGFHGSRQWMRFQPKRASRRHRVNSGCPPPRAFIAATMDLAMVPSTQGHGKLITDLAAESPGLGEAQMMRVRRPASADKTRLFGDIADMIAITDATRFR